MDVRRAHDGQLYTWQAFLDWYGPGAKKAWEHAGVQELDATGLGWLQPAGPRSHPDPPTNQQPTDDTAQQLDQPLALPQNAQLPAGAQEPGSSKLVPDDKQPARRISHTDKPPDQQPADNTAQHLAQPTALPRNAQQAASAQERQSGRPTGPASHPAPPCQLWLKRQKHLRNC